MDQTGEPRPSPRNANYKSRVLSAPYELCIERARYVTQAFRETEGLHPSLRAARAFEKTVTNMTVDILDCEAIGGNRTSKLVGTPLPVERGDVNVILEMELDDLSRRNRRPYRVDPEDARELKRDILPYWRDRSVRARKKRLWAKAGLDLMPSFSTVEHSGAQAWPRSGCAQENARPVEDPDPASVARVARTFVQ